MRVPIEFGEVLAPALKAQGRTKCLRAGLVLLGGLLLTACNPSSKTMRQLSALIKEPDPVTLVVLIDNSASSTLTRNKAIAKAKQLVEPLWSFDHVSIFRFAGRTINIYDSSPDDLPAIFKILDAYAVQTATEYGTNYVPAIRKVVDEVGADLSKRKIAVAVLGDGANEPIVDGKPDPVLQWDALSRYLQKKLPDDRRANFLLAFMFVEEKYRNEIRDVLAPTLRSSLKMMLPEEAESSGHVQVLRFLDR